MLMEISEFVLIKRAINSDRPKFSPLVHWKLDKINLQAKYFK